jgi:hypothetical protein
MLCLNSVSIEVEKMVKGKKWFSDGTLGYISLSQTHNPPLFAVPVGQAEPAGP